MGDHNDKNKECEPPFWKDITIIFKDFSLQYKPNCEHSSWNFLVRLVILSLFVGMIASVLGGLSMIPVTILFGILTAVVIIFTTKPDVDVDIKQSDTYHKLPYIVNVDPSGYLAPMAASEGFVNGGSSAGSVQPHSPSGVVEVDAYPYSGQMLPDYTPPKARNLFMNVLLDEIKYNPGRPEAAPVDNPTVKQTMDDYFRVQWYSDPTDVFGKNQGQRQFVTQPSTTVPNDQGSFADWLYKIPGKTCKEGGREACLPGTDGGPVTWLNQDS
jgi:hypothetical protein